MPEQTTASNAAALIIGNELLSGKTRDSNLFELARTLRALGVRLERVVMVCDEIDVIAQEVAQLSAAFDVVFTSGGVGVTHDDVTIDAVAKAFGVSTSMDAEVTALLRRTYGDRCSDAHLRMALVPDGAQLAATSEVPWPIIVMRNVWVLPGVPEVFRMKLSVIRSLLRGPTPLISRAVFTHLEETELKPLLEQIVVSHPLVEVGSYPKWFDPEYKTKVTFDARQEQSLDAALEEFLTLLPPETLQRVE
jgi:molybdenum cofactor synthesis domain-containing protein